MQNKPVRINFRINYCSSEDKEFPVNELTLQSPEAKGWQSKRFSTYPQTIIIQLAELAYIEKLTFLSHQTKITTKIDIQSKSDHNQPWKKLGYTCMQSNMITNYEARELRTVKLSKQLVILFRFTFHNNFSNNQNVFNQVGIISLCVYGVRFNPKPEQEMKQQGILPPGAILDRQTLDKLRELEYMRRDAIQKNQFQNAKKIKEQIEKLRGGVNALAILQKQKREAIKREDYQSAKQIYQKMNRIRGPLPRASHSSNDRYQNLQKQKQFRNNASFTPIQNNLKNSQHSYLEPIVNVKNQKMSKNKSISFDQIKIQPKTRNIFDQENILQEQNRYQNQNQDQIERNNKMKVPLKQFLKKSIKANRIIPRQHQIQQLNKQLPIQCHQYFPIINQLIFQNLHSDQHTLRQRALQQIANLIDTIPEDQLKQKMFMNAVIYSARQTIGDKIVSVLLKTIDLLGMMLKQFKPKQNQITSQNSKYLKQILQKLVEYLGHSHDKLKNQAQDVYIILPKHKVTSKQICIEAITLSQRIDRVPKSIIAKLTMLGRIIQKYKGDPKDKQHEDIILFANRYIQDRNSQVRSSAIQLIIFMAKHIGYDSVINILGDIKPTTQKLIYQKFYNKKQKSPQNTNKKNSPRVMSPKKNLFKSNQSQQLNNSNSKSINKQTSSPKATQKKKMNSNQLAKNQLNNPEYVCEYCKRFDKRFQNQTFRQVHWFKQCPMITICHECNQAIQIQFFNQHLLSECQRHKFYKKCPRCRQAVLSKDYNFHTQKKNCIAAKPITNANRCPLCHQDIHPKNSGWIKHLANEGCPLSKRQKIN